MTFQLWDVKKMEGSSMVNKAFQMFNSHSGSPLTCLATTGDGGQGNYLMASGAENGSIVVTR